MTRARLGLDSAVLPWLLLSVVALLYLATAGYGVANRDPYSAGVGGYVLAQTGEPWVDPVVGDIDVDYAWLTDSGSHQVVARSPGVIVAAVPSYVVARAFGMNSFSIVPQAVTASLLAALASALLYLTLRRDLGRRMAIGTSLAFALTTPMWSVAGDALWTHAVTVPALAGLAWSASRERWWLVGLFGGIALWGRLHTALIVLIVGVGMALVRRDPRILIKVGLPSGAAMFLAGVWSHWMYGTWSPSGPYGGTQTVARVGTGFGASWKGDLTNQLGMWVSPGWGFLVWTPAVLVLVPALVKGWKEIPAWAQLLAAAGVAYTLAQAQLNTFTGGDGFYGYRHALELLVCLTPSFAYSAHRLGPWARQLLAVLLGLQFAAIALGAYSEGWYVLYTDAWRDNSFWLALRTVPAVAAWPVLTMLIAWLALKAFEARRKQSQTATEPATFASVIQESSRDDP